MTDVHLGETVSNNRSRRPARRPAVSQAHSHDHGHDHDHAPEVPELIPRRTGTEPPGAQAQLQAALSEMDLMATEVMQLRKQKAWLRAQLNEAIQAYNSAVESMEAMAKDSTDDSEPALELVSPETDEPEEDVTQD